MEINNWKHREALQVLDCVFKSKLLTLNFGIAHVKPLCRSTSSFFSLLQLQLATLKPRSYKSYLSYADFIIRLLDYEESERLVDGLDLDLTGIHDAKTVPMSPVELEFAVAVMTSKQLKSIKFGEVWRMDQRLLKSMKIIETPYQMTNLQCFHLPPLGVTVQIVEFLEWVGIKAPNLAEIGFNFDYRIQTINLDSLFERCQKLNKVVVKISCMRNESVSVDDYVSLSTKIVTEKLKTLEVISTISSSSYTSDPAHYEPGNLALIELTPEFLDSAALRRLSIHYPKLIPGPEFLRFPANLSNLCLQNI